MTDPTERAHAQAEASRMRVALLAATENVGTMRELHAAVDRVLTTYSAIRDKRPREIAARFKIRLAHVYEVLRRRPHIVDNHGTAARPRYRTSFAEFGPAYREVAGLGFETEEPTP